LPETCIDLRSLALVARAGNAKPVEPVPTAALDDHEAPADVEPACHDGEVRRPADGVPIGLERLQGRPLAIASGHETDLGPTVSRASRSLAREAHATRDDPAATVL